MRKTRVGKRIYVHGVPLCTSSFCPYCCATVDTASSLWEPPEAERVRLLSSLVYLIPSPSAVLRRRSGAQPQ